MQVHASCNVSPKNMMLASCIKSLKLEVVTRKMTCPLHVSMSREQLAEHLQQFPLQSSAGNTDVE